MSAINSCNSFFTTGASKYKPMMFGNDMAKVMANEKPITALKLMLEPITIKTKNMDLKIFS